MKLNLISNGRSNPKTEKSNKESDKYLTFILQDFFLRRTGYEIS